MQKQFVTYDIALKLKELGFDKVCLAVYFRNKFQLVKGFNINNVDLHVANQMDAILAPLWQQVIDWFREKYSVYIWIYYCMILESNFYQIRHEVSTNEYHNYSNDSESNVMHEFTFEEAREQAILKAIELCKKNL